MARTRTTRLFVLILVSLLAGNMLLAEDVEKKIRLGFSIGGYSTQDKIESDAANSLLLLDQDEVPFLRVSDPRNDDAALGDLKIKPTQRVLFTAQYAVNKILMLEGAVGYQKGAVGEVEVQAQFFRVEIPETRNFNFSVHRIEAGDLEQIPIQLSAIARFRPRAAFNPYLGAGIGYTIVGFTPSSEFNELSYNLDSAIGSFAALSSSGGKLVAAGEFEDLTGATVMAPDTFEWHGVGGAEYSFKRKWAAFVDLRYVFASRRMSLRFNGARDLGYSVPQGVAEQDSPEANPSQYGAIAISNTGLVDGGRLIPTNPSGIDEADYAAFCEESPNDCTFVFEPDGQLDPGEYYIKGGDIKYGGFSLGFGIRYTF